MILYNPDLIHDSMMKRKLKYFSLYKKIKLFCFTVSNLNFSSWNKIKLSIDLKYLKFN